MRKPILGYACAIVLSSQAPAGPVFTHNFDMRGNYTQYLYSTTNAFVNNEAPSFPDVYYWAPTQDNTWAEIVYRYDLGFQIGGASTQTYILSTSISTLVPKPTSTCRRMAPIGRRLRITTSRIVIRSPSISPASFRARRLPTSVVVSTRLVILGPSITHNSFGRQPTRSCSHRTSTSSRRPRRSRSPQRFQRL